MRCPHCNESGAYTGLQWIHCQNKECRYFDARYTEQIRKEKQENSSFFDKVEKLILLRGEVADDDDS